jgi:Zn-dependent protease with chaperone function
MPASHSEELAYGRPNPFAFPSDTSARFLLLLIFAIATDSIVWGGVAGALSGVPPIFSACVHGWSGLGAAFSDQERLAEISACQTELYNRYLPTGIGLQPAGLGLLVVATLAIWWLHPYWIGWRMALSTLDERDAPELRAELKRLCRIAGLRRDPQFYWNPLGLARWALAYGRAGRYRVALTGATAVQFTTDPDAFRASMLHEIAHIANRDVDKTQLALAIWWGLLLTGFLPLVIASAWVGTPRLAAVSGIAQTIGITTLVALTFNGILRARELYADTRASSWLEDASGLARALGELRPGVGRVRRLISPHPDPVLRQGLLRSTAPLFRAGFWDLFGVGTAISLGGGFLFTQVTNFATFAVSDSTSQTALELILPGLMLTPLIAVIAVTMIWRATFAALLRNRPPRAGIRSGVALGAGMVVGGLLYGLGFPSIWLTEVPPWSVVAAIGLWALLGFLPAIALLGWSEAIATAWLPKVIVRSRPGSGLWLAVLGCAVLALPWFALAGPIGIGSVVAYENYPKLRPLIPAPPAVLLYGMMGTWPVGVFAAICALLVWALPIAAGMRRRIDVAAAWNFLRPPPAEPPKIEGLRSTPALLCGLAGGAFGGILLLLGAGLPLPAEAFEPIGFPLPIAAKLLPIISPTANAILIDAVIAVIAVLVSRRLRLVHAMCAAFLAANLLALGVSGHLVLEGEHWHAVVVMLKLSYGPIVIAGLAIALVAVLATLALEPAARRVAGRRRIAA